MTQRGMRARRPWFGILVAAMAVQGMLPGTRASSAWRLAALCLAPDGDPADREVPRDAPCDAPAGRDGAEVSRPFARCFHGVLSLSKWGRARDGSSQFVTPPDVRHTPRVAAVGPAPGPPAKPGPILILFLCRMTC